MDDELLGAVLGRLDRHPVPEPVSKLLLAALEGEETLHQVALGEAHPTPPQPEATSSSVQPAGAYLEALTVTGFRGIGPSTTLPLQPGPGLTVVVGRNGSGKSSFAEALELLLTGEIRRWADRSATWREGWRNLHGGQEPSIEARLTIEDAPGSSTLRRTWQPEGALESGVTTVQVAGERQQPPERLGWGEALGLYRPFLSHVELETMLRRPSDLYDVLVRLLDLDDLWDAVDRLDLVTKAARAPLAEAKRSLPGLLGELKSMDDERARGCVRALEAKDWDLDEAEGLATGIAGPTAGGELDHLRQLAQVWPPSGHEVAEAASALREAARRADAVAGTDAGRALALADLLDAALAHHRGHGDGPCPVCGRPGALEESWRSATEEQVARLRSEASAATAAKNAATAARSRVVRLLGGPPTVLERGVEGVDTG
ncbi:MAG TPA: ATP-binding protein, partial [Acidimicrobiales bacterium]|nr:ATP-binding protein [Acidimicrobiales bacterium]